MFVVRDCLLLDAKPNSRITSHCASQSVPCMQHWLTPVQPYVAMSRELKAETFDAFRRLGCDEVVVKFCFDHRYANDASLFASQHHRCAAAGGNAGRRA